MWYGTEDGLCRDDGYNIHTFRSDFKNPDIMLSNTITCLAEDSIMHHIWIGTTQGLYILDKRTYTISPVKTADLGKGNIDAINVTADHSIWVSVYRKIVRLDAMGQFSKVILCNVPMDRVKNLCCMKTENISCCCLYPAKGCTSGIAKRISSNYFSI